MCGEVKQLRQQVKPKPRELSLNDDGDLVIAWSDDETRTYKVSILRDNCPCATCREKRKAPAPTESLLPVMAPEDFGVKITEMKPVGTYAYGITFSDGHDSGIYTLEHLFALGGG